MADNQNTIIVIVIIAVILIATGLVKVPGLFGILSPGASLDKNTVSPGEEFTVTIEGPDLASSEASAALYLDGAVCSRKPTGVSGATAITLTCNAPSIAGNYELRAIELEYPFGTNLKSPLLGSCLSQESELDAFRAGQINVDVRECNAGFSASCETCVVAASSFSFKVDKTFTLTVSDLEQIPIIIIDEGYKIENGECIKVAEEIEFNNLAECEEALESQDEPPMNDSDGNGGGNTCLAFFTGYKLDNNQCTQISGSGCSASEVGIEFETLAKCQENLDPPVFVGGDGGIGAVAIIVIIVAIVGLIFAATRL